MCLTPTFAYSSRFRSGKVLLPAQAANQADIRLIAAS
jgi:hypothetical protein